MWEKQWSVVKVISLGYDSVCTTGKQQCPCSLVLDEMLDSRDTCVRAVELVILQDHNSDSDNSLINGNSLILMQLIGQTMM